MEVRFEKNIITGEEIEVIVKANRLTNNVKSLMLILINLIRSHIEFYQLKPMTVS